ncbi:hypothetical protein [Leisingera caerulea]|nr:hypothetical protein [Leisingera caerulea]
MKAEQQHGSDVATLKDLFKPEASGATFWPEAALSGPFQRKATARD